MQQAVSRFFRSYYMHSTAPSADSLFNLLNSLHSLNDRLRKNSKINFFGFQEFLALKTMRNFFHHEAELPSKVTIIPLANFAADLPFMCLTPSKYIVRACAKLSTKEAEAINSVIRFYGTVADLNPCIFNCVVKIFEKTETNGLAPKDEPAYEEFRASYEYESQNGHPHLVKGELRMLASEVPALVAAIQKASQDDDPVS
jgi:hypothetical protein